MKQVGIWALGACALMAVGARPASAVERYSEQLERSAESLRKAVAEKDRAAIRREGMMLSRIVGALAKPEPSTPKCFASANALYGLTIDLQSSDLGIVSAAKGRFAKFQATMPACRAEDGAGEDVTKPPGRGV